MSMLFRRFLATSAALTTVAGLGLVQATSASASPAPTSNGAAVADVSAAATLAKPPPDPPSLRQSGVTAGVTQPLPSYQPKGSPPEPGVQQPPSVDALTYLYGNSYQYAAADGSYANYTVAKPFLAAGDFHTLAELAAQSADGQQIVEVGWTVDRGLNGDDNPHLFVYHWVDRTPSCYNGCGYVQYSATIRPGATLPVGGLPLLSIRHYQGNWWIYYGTEWIGYYPDALWGGRYTSTGLTQWFGEVAANSAAPCTDMGNGQFASSASATAISGISFYAGPAVSITSFGTNPSYYSAQATSSNSARYGGPGAC
jgi:hypothetical protein